jgi:protein-S-isoprenylcysteine O-methyltransferase Ste14
MNKLTAVVCVVSWSAALAFGSLALTENSGDSSFNLIAAVLALAGLLAGILTWRKLPNNLQ